LLNVGGILRDVASNAPIPFLDACLVRGILKDLIPGQQDLKVHEVGKRPGYCGSWHRVWQRALFASADELTPE
jgi:hypothetical protein